jgi:hypothetical protein
MALVSISRRDNTNRPIIDQSASSSRPNQQRQPLTRTRSQSIKIPQYGSKTYGHPSNFFDESTMKVWEDDATILEEQYESATLRMYYRITDYRQRNPSLYITDDSVTSTQSPTQFPELPMSIAIQSNNELQVNANNTTYISEENGAIFEMDL